MADQLAGLLRHYLLSARAFHSGALCGQHHYAAPHGYIHLVRYDPIMVHSPVHEDLLVTESSLLFHPRVTSYRSVTAPGSIAERSRAEVNLGASADNPLAMTLSSMLLIPPVDLPGLRPTLELLSTEAERSQCGRRAVIDRLCELLLIQLLRYLVDGRLGVAGLLVGLADSKLVRTITAMHDTPQTAWSLEALAARAGMSHACLVAAFKDVVGVIPGDYLADWRMNVSYTLLKQGWPVAVVADRAGYSNPSALVRAFRMHVDCTPRD